MRGSIQKRKAKNGALSYSILFDVPPKLGKLRRQRRISGFSTRKLAERKLRDLLSRIEAGKYFEATTLTVAEYGDQWLAALKRTVRARTHLTYTRWFKDHIGPRIGHLALPAIKSHHLIELYMALLEGGRKKKKEGKPAGLHPRSVGHTHRVASLLFASAVERGLIEKNPCAEIARKHLPRVPKIEERVLDESEARSLIGAANGTRLFPFVVLALYTGARKGELLALTWQRADLDSGRITIAHTLADDGSLGEVKRERSRRTIVVPQAAISVLRAHKAAQASQRLAKGPLYEDRGFVFADELGKPWKCQSIGTLFRAIVKRAGLDVRVHPHTCRHTFASLALKAGVPITTLAATLGHDVQTLMSIYSHHIPSAEDTAAKAMQNALA